MKHKKRKILVTGAAGYIGDAAVRFLLGTSCDVTALDNLMYGGSYMRRHPALNFVRGDITDYKLMRELIKDHDAVVHLAAIVGDGACQANPKITLDVNQEATESIAYLCSMYDTKMVFASTCSVYGVSNELLDEASPTNPLSIYAGTKLKAEEAVREVPEHYIFRLGTLFGLSSEHARLRCDLVANILTYRALAGEKLSVFGGEQWRPLLHVKDAAETLALASSGSGIPGGTYILARDNYTILDLAKTVAKLCDLDENSLEVTELPYEDQRNYKVSDNRAGKVWRCRRTLDDGIIEMAKLVREGRIADVWDVSHHNARFVQETIKNESS
jgi:nucleoside-diphosphate-sugar epimerase